MSDSQELEALAAAVSGSVKRRLILWAVRWLLGFAIVAVIVEWKPHLSWLWLAAAGVAALSLLFTVGLHFFTRGRMARARRSLAEYERIAREAELRAAEEGNPPSGQS